MSDSPRRRAVPLYGLAAFAVIMLLFFLVFAPLQYYFGMTGLALTELGLLAATLLMARFTGKKLRLIFPVRRPLFRELAGTFFIWSGSFLLVTLCTLLLTFFFPEGVMNVSSGLNFVFSSVPAPVGFVIVAVLPAVCEEAMHRGLIQYTFQPLKKDWLIVICMGLLFGLFHMDPYRFLPTALLGAGLSYVMQKTHNLLLPAFFHFTNNAFSFLSGMNTTSESISQAVSLVADKGILLSSLGSWMLFASLAPVLLFAGGYFLNKDKETSRKPGEMKTIVSVILVLLASALLTTIGILLLVSNMDAVMKLSYPV